MQIGHILAVNHTVTAFRCQVTGSYNYPAGNAKGWRDRENEKKHWQIFFRKPPKLIWVWLNTERELLFGEG